MALLHSKKQQPPVVHTTKRYAPRIMIDNTVFVKAWLQYETVGDVAQHLDVSVAAASAKASNLRSKGVKLPIKRNLKTEVDKLNTLIARFKKG